MDTRNGKTLMGEDHEHCWHSDGVETTLGNRRAGSQRYTCCRCGERKHREWYLREKPIEGHGPHVKRRFRVYKDTDPADE